VFKEAEIAPTEIHVPQEMRLTREEFVDNFKFYVQSLEEVFPFRHKLLLEPIKDVIKEELSDYGFSVEDLLDLVPTGIEALDDSEGGLVKKTSTLLLAGDTRDKERFLLSFSRQGAVDKDGVIYLSSRQPSEVILNAILRDVDALDGVTLMDLYRAVFIDPVKEVIVEGNRIILPVNLTLIRYEMVKAIKGQLREVHKRVVVDILNDLLRYYGFRQISSVVFKWLEGFRKWNCTSVFALDPNLLGEGELAELEKKFDNVIELVDTEAGIRVKRMYGSTPHDI
ncbi:MAG: RAD55 family ATPase, partial [Candidatus Hydrothermarchaeaceae archaeon]